MSREKNCRSQGKYSPSLTRKALTPFLGSTPARADNPGPLLLLMLSGQHYVGPWEQNQAHTVAFTSSSHAWLVALGAGHSLHSAAVGSEPASPYASQGQLIYMHPGSSGFDLGR